MNKPKALPELHPSDVARFWSSVEVGSLNQCWPWKLATHNRGGYGQFQLGGRPVRAHRVAFYLFYGVDPEGLFVLHDCDNPPCCNGAHLFGGTAADNSADCAAKGRLNSPNGKRSGRYTRPDRTARGEGVGGAKLTAGDVREMRRLYLTGEYSQQDLADRFGVGRENIGQILRGENWAHIESDPEAVAAVSKQRRAKAGENNNSAKLKEWQVREIRALYATGEHGYRPIAERYGVNPATVRAIVQRKIWANL